MFEHFICMLVCWQIKYRWKVIDNDDDGFFLQVGQIYVHNLVFPCKKKKAELYFVGL